MMRRLLLTLLFACALPAFGQYLVTATFSASAASCAVGTTPTACLFFVVPPNINSADITIAGTYSGTNQFEVSGDGGTTWVPVLATLPGSTAAGVTSTTSTATWTVSAAGHTHIRVRCSAYTSGGPIVTINPSQAVTAGSGGGGGGTVTSVSGTSPITSSGGNTPAIGCATCVNTGQAAALGAFLYDFSLSTMEIPESAAFVSTVDSTVGIDTNSGIEHLWGPGAADSFNVVTSSTSTTTTQPIFATATAGLYAPRAIAAADIPSGTVTLDKVGGAAAAGTITESAVSRPITFAGVETANLTYPTVFQNTNSTNNNTSGAVLANCAGTDNAQTCLMVNNLVTTTGLLASFNTGGTVTNGVISGQTQIWSVTGQGAVTEANSLTVSAGVVTVPAGSTTASLAFAGDTAGAGLYRAGAAVYGITNGTNEVLRLQATGIKGTSGGGYGFTASSSSSTGAYDTAISRQAAGVFGFNTDTGNSNEAALIRAGNPCRVTADATISVSGTAVTMCQWSLPAVAKAWAWQCQVLWAITAGTTPTISIGVNPSQTPTGTTNTGAEIITSLANIAVEGSAAISASGATNVLTSGTLTPSATLFQAQTFGTLLASATAGTFTITMTGTGTSVAGAIKAGTTCSFY